MSDRAVAEKPDIRRWRNELLKCLYYKQILLKGTRFHTLGRSCFPYTSSWMKWVVWGAGWCDSARWGGLIDLNKMADTVKWSEVD